MPLPTTTSLEGELIDCLPRGEVLPRAKKKRQPARERMVESVRARVGGVARRPAVGSAVLPGCNGCAICRLVYRSQLLQGLSDVVGIGGVEAARDFVHIR